MGTNTGIGIGIGIPFKNNVLGEGKPYLPPEIKDSLKAVVIAYGKTNNDSDRAIVKNLVDASNPFVISNAAFKLNSGFGKYETELSNTRIWTQSKETTSSPFSSNYNGLSGWIVFANTELTNSADMPSFKIQVKGLLEGQELIYRYYDSNGQSNVYSMGKDGEYTLPADIRTAKPQTSNTSGFQVVKNDTNTITITQIPSFVGAFVTDGVNDLITSTKTVQEMLGGSNEITVVSMMANLDSRQILCNSNYSNTNGYNVRNTLEPNGVISMLGYTDKNGTTNNINLIMGDKNSIKLVDKVNFNSDYVFYPAQYYKGYYQVAWYWTIIANKVLTTDQINQVIAYFNLDRTLKPDILCNITKQGITNDNHADFNDKLIDYSGNGRDIQMNNLAWKGGSGIAAKPFETIKDYTILSDEARQKLTIYNEFSYKVESNIPNHYWIVQSIIKDNTSYQVTIITDKDCYWINSTSFINNEGNKESIRKEYPVKANTPTQVTICGLNEFEYPEDIEPTTAVSYVNLSYAGEVTVTFIPSCKGGLLLDGVNDFGKVTGMPVYKDYTVIADYIRISAKENAQDSPILSKSKVAGSEAFLFNYLNADSVTSSFSFGTHNALKEINDFERKIYYLSKYASDGYNVNAGYAVDYDTMWLGAYRDNAQNFFNGAIYSLMSFPYSMSEFLIERQLKKHKLGTLYPNMMEFRPVIKSNVLLDAKPTFIIRGTSTYLNAGDYVPENSQIWVSIKMNNIADRITKFTVNGKTIDIPENAYSEVTLQYGFPFVIDKSPQKIGITIEQDENYVLFNPVINSNYDNYKLTFHLREYEKLINIGDYIPKGTYIRANLYLKNDIDELVTFTFNGVNIDYAKSPVLDTAYNIRQIYNYDSPQEVDITIDEYIRFEDIVQPYPLFFEFTDENGNLISWGGKAKVGSTITRTKGVAYANLLEGLFTITNQRLNGVLLSSFQHVVEKSMVFTCTATWAFDNNEPKCILSPRLLRIPNSSYKILGYIPDISGHGNNGKINNSAYAEGSGVNEDGSYQFDGVDDFVTIPTVTGGKQVLMKVNWQSYVGAVTLYDQRLNLSDYEFAIYNGMRDLDDNPVMAYQGRNNGQTYIDGILNSNIMASELKAITHNITITNELSLGINNTYPVIGSTRSNTHFAQMSLYDFMLFDEISTDDKIKELNEYVGIEAKVELPPYY